METNIILFSTYKRGMNGMKDNQKNMQPVKINALIEKFRDSHKKEYSVPMAEGMADEVLAAGGWAGRTPVPVMDIAESFGFKVYTHSGIPDGAAGNIYVGGTTESMYGTDRIILIGDREELPHQRFIIAHELGHFLMEYLGSGWEDTPNKVFTMAYSKERHERGGMRETCADRFAAELLMPRGEFGARYLRAMENLMFDKEYAVPVLAQNFCVKPSSVTKRIAEISSVGKGPF